MKNMITVIIIVSLLTLLIFVSGMLSKKSLDMSSEKLDSHIAVLEASVEKGEWENAEKILLDLEKDWHKTKAAWAMLTDHMEIDNIDASLARFPKYLETRQLPLLLAEVSVLRHYIRHIPKKESLSLENIL